MGNVQCTSIRNGSEVWNDIESDFNRRNSNLEKKILKEFDFLRSFIGVNNHKTSSIKFSAESGDFKFMMKIYMASPSVSLSTKMGRFIKWYQMAFYIKGKNTKRVIADICSSSKSSHGRRKSVSGSINTPLLSGNNLFPLNEDSYCNYDIMLQSNIDKNLLSFYLKKPEKFLERVSKGPPNSFRWFSWKICMNISTQIKEEIFFNFVSKETNEDVDTQIKKDLNRTLTEEACFNNNSEVQQALYRLLRAVANLDDQVTYCQGMNFLAGTLLIVSDFNEAECFFMLVSLLSHETFNWFEGGNNPIGLGIRGFYFDNFPCLQFFIFVFEHYFKKKMADLKKHFEKIDLPNEVWISKWLQTLFTIAIPLHDVVRLWDCLFSLGLFFIINFTLALLRLKEEELIKLEEAFDVVDFFRKTYQSGKFDIEEVITEAKKIKIKLESLKRIKKEYEEKNKIDLTELNIVYDLYNKNALYTEVRENSSINFISGLRNPSLSKREEYNYNVFNINSSFEGISSFVEDLIREENETEEFKKQIHASDNNSSSMLGINAQTNLGTDCINSAYSNLEILNKDKENVNNNSSNNNNYNKNVSNNAVEANCDCDIRVDIEGDEDLEENLAPLTLNNKISSHTIKVTKEVGMNRLNK